MYTSHGGGANDGRRAFAEDAGGDSIGRVEHYCCGAAGLLMTAVVAILLYPLLVAFTEPLYLLSSTAISVVFIVTWLTTWGLLEFVWELRAGRLPTG